MRLSDEGLEAIATDITTLTKLDVSGCSIKGPGISSLAKSNPGLVSLSLESCSLLKGDCLACLSNHLRTLNLGECNRIEELYITRLVSRTHHLRELNLNRVGVLSDSVPLTMGRYCRELEKLELAGCTGVTDIGVEAITRNCPLHSLNLQACGGISSGFIAKVTSQCPTLRALDVSLTGKVDDAAVTGLTKDGRRLQKLGIAGCTASKQVLKELSKCTELEDLDLSGTTRLVDEVVHALRRNCHKLSKLVTERCYLLS